MDKKLKYAKYGRDEAHSYTLGAFPTMELILSRPEAVMEVVYHSDFRAAEGFCELEEACLKNGLRFREASRQVERLRDKDKCLVIGVLSKYGMELDRGAHHLVLVSPMDMGNLGTILRTALGFHFKDIALIEPCADFFNPKVLRASMGALFKLRVKSYHSFEAYLEEAALDSRTYYPFMLSAPTELSRQRFEGGGAKSLIFGNEASGLDSSFMDLGSPTLIAHSSEIDSLNLALAVGIALYDFDCKKGEKLL